MAVSNAIGSNIFDILAGLGLPWFVVLLFGGPSIVIETENLIGSIVLLFATVLSILFLLIIRNWRIGRRAGIVLIAAYVSYVVYAVSVALR
jgi:Ca2+/Na+ antiporter